MLTVHLKVRTSLFYFGSNAASHLLDVIGQNQKISQVSPSFHHSVSTYGFTLSPCYSMYDRVFDVPAMARYRMNRGEMWCSLVNLQHHSTGLGEEREGETSRQPRCTGVCDTRQIGSYMQPRGRENPAGLLCMWTQKQPLPSFMGAFEGSFDCTVSCGITRTVCLQYSPFSLCSMW